MRFVQFLFFKHALVQKQMQEEQDNPGGKEMALAVKIRKQRNRNE